MVNLELFKDKIPDGYSMMGLCYAWDSPEELRKDILEKYPDAKFDQLEYDDIHHYRFFAYLPRKTCEREKYPKLIY